MSQQEASLDWQEIIGSICARGDRALQWDMPESWFHAEIFAKLNKQMQSSGWEPFPFEVPYKTMFPVRKPKGDIWRELGADKWADLCLRSTTSNAWCWFELKVRHMRRGSDTQAFARSAQLAFCKDVTALLGLEIELTAKVWKIYDKHTKAYKNKLTPYADVLSLGKHRCVAAFVQLDLDQRLSQLDSTLWEQRALSKTIDVLLANGANASGPPRAQPDFRLNKLECSGYSLVTCEWIHERRYAAGEAA